MKRTRSAELFEEAKTPERPVVYNDDQSTPSSQELGEPVPSVVSLESKKNSGSGEGLEKSSISQVSGAEAEAEAEAEDADDLGKELNFPPEPVVHTFSTPITITKTNRQMSDNSGAAPLAVFTITSGDGKPLSGEQKTVDTPARPLSPSSSLRLLGDTSGTPLQQQQPLVNKGTNFSR